MADPSIAVLLKAPRPGAVKTRLAREIGSPAATALYRAVAEERLAAARATGWPVTVWYSPADAERDLVEWLGPGDFRPQPEGDLGERMATAARAVEAGDRVIVIGGDCPDLTVEVLRAANQALDRAPVVLGPAADGGYYLIGGRTPLPDVFTGMTWSTATVLLETRRRLREANLAWVELAALRDIDTVADARAAGLLA
jgi:rSAM/selenodomain-associated transferase 1